MGSRSFEYAEWIYGDEGDDDTPEHDRSAGPRLCSVCMTEPTRFAFELPPGRDGSLQLPVWVGFCRVCSDLIAADQLTEVTARLAPDAPIGGGIRERATDAITYLAPLVRRYRPRH